MSRCFPFPPPGYENKTKTDNTDILTKEKRNEKSHKKEKKEKRKREGKEKVIKRSKENDGGKKDRKEKPKDNNVRDKNKGQNKNLDEKRNQVQPEYRNGTSKLHFAANKDNNFILELDRRIRDEDKATGSQMAQKVTLGDQRRYGLPGKAVQSNPNDLDEEGNTNNKREANHKVNWHRDEEKATGCQMLQKIFVTEPRQCELSGTTVESNQPGLVGGVEKTKIKRESNEKSYGQRKKAEEAGPQNSNAKWLRDGDKVKGSQMAQKVTPTDQRTHELPDTAVKSNQMGNYKFNYGQRTKVEETGLQNSIAQNYARMGNQRFDGMARPLEKNNFQNQMDKEANTKLDEGGSRNDKYNDQDGEKKRKSKDKYGEKAKRREEKAKRKEARAKRREEKAKRKEEKEKKKMERANGKKGRINEQKKELNNQQAKLEESSQDSIITCNNIPAHSSKEISMEFDGENNSTKRKGLEINVLSDDNEIRPNKLRRPISSSNPVVENGRNNEPCQNAIELQSNWRKADSMADNRGQRADGFIKAQPPVVCSTSSTSVSDNNSGRSAKPPHPDSMYLNEILSVPQIEEPSVFDDHDWLFSSNNLQSKMPQMDAPGNDRMVEVWAESLQIMVADITALPYVLPY